MTPQTKAIIAGSAAVLVSRFYFHKDWKMSLLIGGAALVAYTIVTDLPDSIV